MDKGKVRINRVVLLAILGTPLAGLGIAYLYMGGGDIVGMPMVPVVAILLLWGLLVKVASEVESGKARSEPGCEAAPLSLEKSTGIPFLDELVPEEVAEGIVARARQHRDLPRPYEPTIQQEIADAITAVCEEMAEEIMERVRLRRDLSWLYGHIEEQESVLEAPLYVSPNPKTKKRKAKRRRRPKAKAES